MSDKWKVGLVTPMPKGRMSTKPGDWLPVSVLPMPSKILERVVHNQIVYHSECNNYFCKGQHGFRKGHSTSSAIFDFFQFCTKLMISLMFQAQFLWIMQRLLIL